MILSQQPSQPTHSPDCAIAEAGGHHGCTCGAARTAAQHRLAAARLDATAAEAALHAAPLAAGSCHDTSVPANIEDVDLLWTFCVTLPEAVRVLPVLATWGNLRPPQQPGGRGAGKTVRRAHPTVRAAPPERPRPGASIAEPGGKGP